MLGAREIVVGGVMEIPKEEGVSFGKERTGGVLGCEVSRLHRFVFSCLKRMLTLWYIFWSLWL